MVNTPLLDQLESGVSSSRALVDWDEDDLMIRSDKLPKIPITKQTGHLSKNQSKQTTQSKELMKDKMVR